MTELVLHDFHKSRGAHFIEMGSSEIVSDYGDSMEEYRALAESAVILDLSFRGRICFTGNDRVRFLHGQVTNDVKSLAPWTGCYSALTTAKGKMQSDLNIYRLEGELLLDFEPGLQNTISERLEKFLVADDVQVLEVASLYGLLSVQGPKADAVVSALGLFESFPEKPFSVVKSSSLEAVEIYLMNQPRSGTRGFDCFVPVGSQLNLMQKLLDQAGAKARLCGWQALEIARVEAGIPRFGADMDETNFPQECGIDNRAVSYTKGCYIGQEILNRIHTLGHVNRELTGLRLKEAPTGLPGKGDKLFDGAKEAGYITSIVDSPRDKVKIALGYIRRELNQIGRDLILRSSHGDTPARIAGLQFHAT